MSGQSFYKVVASKSVQLTVVQSGCCSTRACKIAGGIVAGWCLACGNCRKKAWQLSRDRASAAPFSTPGMCSRTRLHCGKPGKRTGFASSAWLFLPCSSLTLLLPLWPHYHSGISLSCLPIAYPIIIGWSSLTVMFIPSHDWGPSQLKPLSCGRVRSAPP